MVPQVLGNPDLLARVAAEGRSSLGKFDTPGSENGEPRVDPFGLESASSLPSMFSVAPGLHGCRVSPFALDSRLARGAPCLQFSVVSFRIKLSAAQQVSPGSSIADGLLGGSARDLGLFSFLAGIDLAFASQALLAAGELGGGGGDPGGNFRTLLFFAREAEEVRQSLCGTGLDCLQFIAGLERRSDREAEAVGEFSRR